MDIKKLNKENIEEIIPLRIELPKVDFENNLGIDEKILIDKTREFMNENLDKDLFMYGAYIDDKLVSICGLSIFKYFPQADDAKLAILLVYTQKMNIEEMGIKNRYFKNA